MCNPTVRCCQTRLMIRLRISILGNSGGLRMEQAGLFWCRTRAKSFLIKAVSLKFNTLFHSGLCQHASECIWAPRLNRSSADTDRGLMLVWRCWHAAFTRAARQQQGVKRGITSPSKKPQSLVRRLHSGHRTKIKINRSASCLLYTYYLHWIKNWTHIRIPCN